MYIYIYIHIYIHVYIYIYRRGDEARLGRALQDQRLPTIFVLYNLVLYV